MAYIQYFDGSTEEVEDVVEASPEGDRKVTAKVVSTASAAEEPAASDVAETK